MPSLQRERRLQVNGINLVCFEWGSAGGQQALMVHATGFHARCWDRVIAALPDDWHVFAVDMRGHGRSDKIGPFQWQQFGDDLIAACERLDVHDAVGVGHSMGGHCVTRVCADRPEVFKSLVLVDPVIFAPERYREGFRDLPTSLEDHPVARRRSHFASWEEMHERYKDRHPYTLWRPEVFLDYCKFGVEPSKDGNGVDLACPGKIEASIYMGNFSSDLHERIPNIHQPVTVLRATPREDTPREDTPREDTPREDAPREDTPREEGASAMDFASSPTWPGLAAHFANGTDVHLPELTHFMPMQDPELIARYIIESANSESRSG